MKNKAAMLLAAAVLLLSCGSLSLFAEDVVIDANTGYFKSYREIFGGIYDGIFYPEISDTAEVSDKTYELILGMKNQVAGLIDDMCDYQGTAAYSIDKIESGEIEVRSHKSSGIIDIARFVAPEQFDNFEKPVLLVDEGFISKDHITVFLTSLMRELKVIRDYYDRIDNNWYTAWDEIENTMYMFDSFYFQARFVEDFFIAREYYVTRYEGFMTTNYREELLRSFLYFYYGIDRDTMILGYSSLQNFANGEISIDDFINAVYDWTHREFFEEVEGGNEQLNQTKLAIQFTYCAYYNFLLNHIAVKRAEMSAETSEKYGELLDLVFDISQRNAGRVGEFRQFVESFQANLAPLAPPPPPEAMQEG